MMHYGLLLVVVFGLIWVDPEWTSARMYQNDGDDPQEDAVISTDLMIQTNVDIPLIDGAVPARFETASFGLG